MHYCTYCGNYLLCQYQEWDEKTTDYLEIVLEFTALVQLFWIYYRIKKGEKRRGNAAMPNLKSSVSQQVFNGRSWNFKCDLVMTVKIKRIFFDKVWNLNFSFSICLVIILWLVLSLYTNVCFNSVRGNLRWIADSTRLESV